MFLPTGPTIIKDELLYKENAELLFNGKYFYHPIYPPLYSLVISIAFFFKNWYESIQIINCITSTLLIIPIWMISRMFVSYTKSLIILLLTVLLPFQAIYPGYVMSENLFLFIFAFTVYFSIQGSNTTYLKAGLFGISLGLGYLTKYLMLPAIPILIFFWLLLPITTKNIQFKIFKLKHFWINCLLLAFCFLITMLPWIFFSQKSNIRFSDAFGFFFTDNKVLANISTNFFSNERNLNSLLMWGSAYASYIILALSPFLTTLMIYFSSVRVTNYKKTDFKFEHISLLLISLLLMYWLVSTQHSFRAAYNYPNPAYLLGRYLMHLTPLFLVIGIISIDKIFNKSISLKKNYTIVAILIMIILMLFSRNILYKNWIWIFKSSFANSTFNSPDSLFYKIDLNFNLSIILISVLGLMLIIAKKIEIKKTKFILALFATILVLWQSLIFINASERIKNNISGIHARKFAGYLKNNFTKKEETTVYYSVRYLWPKYWESVSYFWGAPKLNYIPVEGKIPVCDTMNSVFLLTEDSLSLKPITSYKFLGGNCYIYKIKKAEIENLPFIEKKIN
ncbi:MAG: glycosyltransferase family 39 protein [Bacteroidota bacterium]